MFNITINLRKIGKKFGFVLFLVCVVIFIIISIKKICPCLMKIKSLKSNSILEYEFAFNDFDKINFKKANQMILSSELLVINNDDNIEKKGVLQENNEQANTIVDQNVQQTNNNEFEKIVAENSGLQNKNIRTEIQNDKNLRESFNTEYHGVKIKNESKYSLTEEILTPNEDFTNKNILIFHTHTCESYTQTNENSYKESGIFRTIDLNHSVVRVGEELTNYLIKNNFNVIHDTTYHDYPAYTGSYNRSFLTVKSILEQNPDIQTVIDLHRDAIGNKSEYGPAVKIGEERVAQLMFVIGTDGGGLTHPNWQKNLKLAMKIQEKANELYPGLFRPIIVRNSRYNQNLADGAFIIEVGATGNTLEECLRKYEVFS